VAPESTHRRRKDSLSTVEHTVRKSVLRLGSFLEWWDLRSAASADATLEADPHSQLRSERDADRSPGAEKVSEGASGYAELLQAGNRLGRAAIWICTDAGDIAGLRFRRGHGKRRDVGHIVRARVVAVEEIEEFNKRRDGPAFTQPNRAAHAQIGLNIGNGAKLVERSKHAIDRDTLAVVRRCNGEGAGALGLR
jgi:hypothetical protein